MKIVYNNILPFRGFKAINLFGVVFARKQYEPLKEKDLLHEAIHSAQMREMFYAGFYLWYVVEWLIRGANLKAYYNLSLEREAFAGACMEGYLDTRKCFNWTKFLKK